MAESCVLNSSDGYCKNDSFDYDLDEILRYKNENCFVYDGKRVRWTDSFEMLKIFTKHAMHRTAQQLVVTRRKIQEVHNL
jgi:predicted transcriptional regulator